MGKAGNQQIAVPAGAERISFVYSQMPRARETVLTRMFGENSEDANMFRIYDLAKQRPGPQRTPEQVQREFGVSAVSFDVILRTLDGPLAGRYARFKALVARELNQQPPITELEQWIIDTTTTAVSMQTLLQREPKELYQPEESRLERMYHVQQALAHLEKVGEPVYEKIFVDKPSEQIPLREWLAMHLHITCSISELAAILPPHLQFQQDTFDKKKARILQMDAKLRRELGIPAKDTQRVERRKRMIEHVITSHKGSRFTIPDIAEELQLPIATVRLDISGMPEQIKELLVESATILVERVTLLKNAMQATGKTPIEITDDELQSLTGLSQGQLSWTLKQQGIREQLGLPSRTNHDRRMHRLEDTR
ncbi:MAG: hypothetical protein KGJ07_01855 [Patescibacteria group bacterium]|nr:hypothetical protein [Patescibacteria group bacterium]MDE2589451.1 hypothetical protein [Patescibacteria group bacterium]